MNYKVGDTVKLVSVRPNTWNVSGHMDRFLGSIQKIKFIHDNDRVEFENPLTDQWTFRLKHIESVVPQLYPKVMWVSDDTVTWVKRVIFAEKCGCFLAWNGCETLEQAQWQTSVTTWLYGKDVLPVIELTIQEIAEKFNLHPEQIRIKE